MGRELKRVPLDFKFPIGQIWTGYINPYTPPAPCKACDRTGFNPATRRLEEDFYGRGQEGWQHSITQDEVAALVTAGRLHDLACTWTPRKQNEDGTWSGGWEPKLTETGEQYMPTAEEVNHWSRTEPMGHDGVNRWILVETRAKRLGIYGKCEYCNGEGELPIPDPKIAKLYEEWEKSNPPSGEGYQLWSTTTEGHPLSPVFATLDDLCEWCEPNATTFASMRASAASWKQMLGNGLVVHQEGNMVFL
jgi:hypothetical protein